MDKEAVKFVDARGLKCPLPVLRLRREAVGFCGLIELRTNDPAALADVPAFGHERGWHVVLMGNTDGVATWQIRVPEPTPEQPQATGHRR